MAAHPTLSERVRPLSIVPFVKSGNPTFTDWYIFGLGSSLFGKQTSNGPADDTSLLTAFQQCRKLGYFEREHEDSLCRIIGLTLGMIHGGVLLPDGTPRPDATILVTLSSQESIRGYHAGQEFFFTDADEDEDWYLSDDRLFAWFRELAEEYTSYQDALGTVRFALGTILGELSGHLFPWTHQEQHACETCSINALGYVCQINPKSIVATRQFAVQAVRVASSRLS